MLLEFPPLKGLSENCPVKVLQNQTVVYFFLNTIEVWPFYPYISSSFVLCMPWSLSNELLGADIP